MMSILDAFRVAPSLRIVRRGAAGALPLVALLVLPGLGSAELADRRGGGALTTPAEAEVLAGYALEFKNHDVTLSQPFFEGRAPGTRGNVLAAEYLEFNFRKIGLKPAFATKDKASDGTEVVTKSATYRQPFRQGTTLKVVSEKVSYEAGGRTIKLQPGVDFNTLGYSGDAEAAGPLVFCGYGIPSGEKDYTSFPDDADGKKADLTGKIAVVLRFEPMDENGESKWAGQAWSFAAAVEPKVIAAADRGAAGVILVCAPGAADERTKKLETVESLRPNREARKVPVVMMSIDAMDALVKAADAQHRSLMDLRKIVDEKGEIIDLPGATLTLTTDVNRDPVMTDNVGAVLAGSGDLADQYVVLGAHYDHVGYGLFGSREGAKGQLHPGADDNASGTSALLVVADRLAKEYAKMPADQPRRSILFLGFSAEESGLNGSRFYVRNPSVPKDKMYIMLNMDMVGRMKDDQVEISGVGTGEGLADFVKPYFDSSGLKIASKPGGGGPSDHASFNAAQIPVMFFFTGLHNEYHTPADVSSLINNEGAARVIDLAKRMTMDLARRSEPMPYTGENLASMTPHQAGDLVQPGTTAPPAPVGDNPGPTATRVRFGIAPGDYAPTETDPKGVLVGEVYPGWPAELAGLKKGDRMIKWNGKDIDSVASWMPLLSALKPGDKVEIVYVRDKKEVTTTATMKARQGQ